jgi:lysophospholipase L1-like esterase
VLDKQAGIGGGTFRTLPVVALVVLILSVATVIIAAEPVVAEPAGYVPVEDGTYWGEQWAGPQGQLWIVNYSTTPIGGQLGTRGVLRAIGLDGTELRRLPVNSAVVDITYDGTGTVYALLDNTFDDVIEILEIAPNGDSSVHVIAEDLYAAAAVFGSSLHLAPDGNLYVHMVKGSWFVVMRVTPATMEVDQETFLGNSSSLEAGDSGLISYWNGRSRFMPYGASAFGETYSSGATTSSDEGTQWSIARDGTVYEMSNAFDRERGGYQCRLSRISAVSPDGTAWVRTVPEMAGVPDDESCLAEDIEALPDGGAVVALLRHAGSNQDPVDSSVELYWLTAAGTTAAVRSFRPQLERVTGNYRDLAPRTTDIAIDDTGTTLLAVTVPNRACEADVPSARSCAVVDLIAYDSSQTIAYENRITAPSTGQDDRSVKLTDLGFQAQQLTMLDGGVALPVTVGAFYCGGGCGSGVDRNLSWLGAGPFVAQPPDGRSGGKAAPTWSRGAPTDGSRFDVVPGTSTTFTVRAVDADGDAVTIEKAFFQPNRVPTVQPSFVRCTASPEPVGRASLTCTVGGGRGSGLAVMAVQAVDAQGNRSERRQYLTAVSPYKYVALGDSYSAGEGLDPYFRDGYTVTNRVAHQPGDVDNRCHRSTRAYAEQIQPPSYPQPLYAVASGGGDPGRGKRINKYGSDLNTRTSSNVAWGFFACAGAVTGNVLAAAEGGYIQSPVHGFRDVVPQVDNSFLNYGTDLVTVTIGGNDVYFANVLTNCAIQPHCASRSYVRDVFANIEALKPRLVDIYQSIRKKTFNADVLVLGYPQLFPDGIAEQTCTELAPWLGEMNFLRQAADRLNAIIHEAATAAGVKFLDVAAEFANHEVCGSQGAWMNGPDLALGFPIDDESFHPNVLGQQAYARVVNRYLRGG